MYCSTSSTGTTASPAASGVSTTYPVRHTFHRSTSRPPPPPLRNNAWRDGYRQFADGRQDGLHMTVKHGLPSVLAVVRRCLCPRCFRRGVSGQGAAPRAVCAPRSAAARQHDQLLELSDAFKTAASVLRGDVTGAWLHASSSAHLSHPQHPGGALLVTCAKPIATNLYLIPPSIYACAGGAALDLYTSFIALLVLLMVWTKWTCKLRMKRTVCRIIIKQPVPSLSVFLNHQSLLLITNINP